MEFVLTGEESPDEKSKKPSRALPPNVADAKRRKKLAEEDERQAELDICKAEEALQKARERLYAAQRDYLVATNELSRLGTIGNRSPVRAHNRARKKQVATKAQGTLIGIPKN